MLEVGYIYGGIQFSVALNQSLEEVITPLSVILAASYCIKIPPIGLKQKHMHKDEDFAWLFTHKSSNFSASMIRSKHGL